MKQNSNSLKLKRLHIDAQIEHIVFMPKDCAIHKSEGFSSLNRVQVQVNKKTLIASLNIIDDGILKQDEAGLSESAWKALNAKEGNLIRFSHCAPVDSMKYVRGKMYGKRLSENNFREILDDVVAGRYSNVELSAFITACAGDNLSLKEITFLTRAMVSSGRRLRWNSKIVADKHCVGGLPGNRTSPIVVAIVAAVGIKIPKTSSRAITSPAGTADTMETLTEVELDTSKIRKVIAMENGCLSWGGSVKLSPADEVLIRIERALDIDSYGQMIASVLSKKSAAGSTHVVIDIPVGKSAKVRTKEDAEKLEYYFKVVAASLNLKIKILITDGSQPVGRGIGPVLEALDVLSVLKNEATAPQDLKQRSLMLAGEILELVGKVKEGKGFEAARLILENGFAYKKFKAICIAQGGMKKPRPARYKKAVRAERKGVVKEIDNRLLAKVAKLAGAPREPGAGVLLLSPLGTHVKKGDILFYVYAHASGELRYTLDYLKQQPDIIYIR
ncbi:thymidine phosphorylase family protein [Aurantibacillus circumpalustris]|uniref:thymidine phosphorylase family protein n=1 Tax=Aurantibacillus circumpalustris TaxID=3036359 RepID=UPI00295BB0BE|nr:thymidine phosphorylase family protein [Aurantibacillus circumpalustris]